MYNEQYVMQKEKTTMWDTIDTAVDQRMTPPEELEAAEIPTAFETLLASAVSDDELRMLKLIDRLLDSSWKFGNGKALRGELRRMWQVDGRSRPRFYKTFYALAERRAL